VLRNRPADGGTFKELLLEVKQTLAEAVENRNYPVEVLPHRLKIPTTPGEFPLFEIVILLENIQDKKYIRQGRPAVIFSFLKENGTLTCRVDYNRSIYEATAIQRMGGHYNRLLATALANPGERVSTNAMLSKEEKRKLLYEFNETGSRYPQDKTIHQLFEEQVERTPSNISIIEPKQDHPGITYRELNIKVRKIADELGRKGIQSGSIVAIKGRRSTELITGILGILKAGCAYLPIDPDYPPERNNYILKDSNAAAILTTGSLNPESAILAPGIRQPATVMAYIIYTSGTTGKPKGVIIEHRNVVRLLVNDAMPFEFSADDTWTMFHSHCFDFSVWEMYGALLYGGRLVIVSKEDARNTPAFLQMLKKHAVTVLNQTPSAFYNLINEELKRSGEEAQKKPSEKLKLRYIIFGGEA
ncbi:MAG: AMP-binding protein, partial [bacterium]|nr:AMP-binding protein [bacterium]